MRAGWRHALQTPLCDVLWRRSDESGEPLLPSALVQALQLEEARAGRRKTRASAREVEAQPTPRPLAVGAAAGRAISFPPAPTKTCAAAPTASLRCASWACRRPTRSTPRSTSATSATGCTRCCGAFHEALPRPAEPPGARAQRACWTSRPTRSRATQRPGRRASSCPSRRPGRRCATATSHWLARARGEGGRRVRAGRERARDAAGTGEAGRAHRPHRPAGRRRARW